MKFDFLKIARPIAFTVFLSLAAGASPVVIEPPALVKGKPAPYSRVKKNGSIWYPAAVVGHYRQIVFSYDYANHKLFADGVETLIESVVVDRVVYVNLAPKVSQGDMRPGMNSLALRRAHLKSMENTSSHMQGNTDALFMSENVPTHAHPWTSSPGDRNGPIINLDPTSEEHVAAHLRPGARPPQQAPEQLPNRLPRPGENTAAEQTASQQPVETVQIPPSEGIPRHVTSQGGPSQTHDSGVTVSTTTDATGLQPIPKDTTPKPEAKPFDSSGRLGQTSGQNSVFLVQVTGGVWQVESNNRILKLKLNQKNRSQVAQSNLGSFTVRCSDGTRVEASRTRSYLPDGTLDPGGEREGELVFRLSSAQNPEVVELEGALRLSVPLRLQ